MGCVHPRDLTVARGFTTGDPTPWRQLRGELIRQMDEGILEPGDEVYLTHDGAAFGLSPAVAKKAFDVLVAEGRLLPSVGRRP